MKMLKKVGLLVMSSLLFTSNVFAAVSKSKTATELNENNISKVTLSLPSDEEKLVSDVVFVIDSSSCGGEAWAQATAMMEQLAKDIEKSDGALKVGAVIFRGVAFKYDFKMTTKDNIKTVMDEIKQKGKETEAFVSLSENKNTMKGSNLHSGLLDANKMLSADKEVPNNRKYVVVISDGITYTWAQDGEQWGINYANGDNVRVDYASNSAYETNKHSLGWTPENEDWGKYLTDNKTEIEAVMNELGTKYDRVNIDKTKYTTPKNEFNTVDVALLKAYEEYEKLNKNYHAYAVALEQNKDQYGYSFMRYLNGKTSTDQIFEDIKYDIYYVVSSGSKVKDVIGYGDNYNFDFVNKAESIVLTVGDNKFNAKLIGDNKYSFADGKYTLEYFPEDDRNEHDYFIWNIDTDVSNFERVSLTYEVQLMMAPTDAGKYTFETNKSAVLTPVDSNGKEGKVEEFEVPKVKFIVEEATGEEAEEEYKKPEVYTGVSGSLRTSAIVVSAIGLMAVVSLIVIKKKNN